MKMHAVHILHGHHSFYQTICLFKLLSH